jgi:hypothetical protein
VSKELKINYNDPDNQRVTWKDLADQIDWQGAFAAFEKAREEANNPNSRRNKLARAEAMTNDELAEKFIDLLTKKPQDKVESDGMRIKSDDY